LLPDTFPRGCQMIQDMLTEHRVHEPRLRTPLAIQSKLECICAPEISFVLIFALNIGHESHCDSRRDSRILLIKRNEFHEAQKRFRVFVRSGRNQPCISCRFTSSRYCDKEDLSTLVVRRKRAYLKSTDTSGDVWTIAV
jgi:hypothetical protein